MASKKEQLELIVEACEEKEGKKRLTCAAAFKLVEEHGLKIKEIGKVCDEQKIKIIKCQLGCFGHDK
jgi:hypothetical protein